MSMLTLTNKMRFGAMRGYQEQIHEAKADNILLVGWGVIFGIRARLIGYPMGSSGSLRGGLQYPTSAGEDLGEGFI